ncbi:Rap1a/Tai family immunity protein [uncultured Cohaesibacter sp.]|uniref:Rap1a/Tai family immunity protein n=1 Tax=uncultured Cohaesibacter sp. TaxID=1002546 RepID=UPI003749C4B3
MGNLLKHFLLAVVLWTGLTLPARTEGVTGNQLLSICQFKDTDSQLTCNYFVAGNVDGLFTGAILVLMQADNNSSTTAQLNAIAAQLIGICGPENGATYEQYKDIVVKYLFSHPELRHTSAKVLIYAALREAFPCR